VGDTKGSDEVEVDIIARDDDDEGGGGGGKSGGSRDLGVTSMWPDTDDADPMAIEFDCCTGVVGCVAVDGGGGGGKVGACDKRPLDDDAGLFVSLVLDKATCSLDEFEHIDGDLDRSFEPLITWAKFSIALRLLLVLLSLVSNSTLYLYELNSSRLGSK
jgi:hypothetical protein